ANLGGAVIHLDLASWRLDEPKLLHAMVTVSFKLAEHIIMEILRAAHLDCEIRNHDPVADGRHGPIHRPTRARDIRNVGTAPHVVGLIEDEERFDRDAAEAALPDKPIENAIQSSRQQAAEN